MSNRQVDPLTPEVIEYAYRQGYFPMPHPDTGEIVWFDPEPRAVFDTHRFRPSRSLRKSARVRSYEVSFDRDFDGVVSLCASRKDTWITSEFKSMYRRMFARKQAHSVEVWHEGNLVGGIFGLHFGAMFHGESMASVMTDASKIALWVLIETLAHAGIDLLEVQFVTQHLESLGVKGLTRVEYHEHLFKVAAENVFLHQEHFKPSAISIRK
jgi:leucyl/phenylalanyl-tRNA--protein transferase